MLTVRKINVFQTAKCLPSLIITAGKVLLKNSPLLFRVLGLQIPGPFVVGTTNTSSNDKDESCQLALVACVVSNSRADLGQTGPNISPAPLKLQVFQIWANHAQETHIGHKSNFGLGTAQELTKCVDKLCPSFVRQFPGIQAVCNRWRKFEHRSQALVAF